MRSVISLHGIRTRGKWQKDLVPLLATEGFRPVPLDYGSYSALELLIPMPMDRKLEWLREEYEKVMSVDPRPSIIAHSFGSWLVANLIEKYPQVKFDKVILTGSIVDSKFDWRKALARDQLNYLRNDYGKKDIWPRVAACCVYKGGNSGTFGFEQKAGLIAQKPFEYYTHSTCFTRLHFEREWLPVLKSQVLHVPAKGISFLLDEKNQRSIVELLDVVAKTSATKLGIDPLRVRGNIFIESETGILRIPSGLHYNMENEQELTVPIPVGQGCTGQSYTSAKRAWAVFDIDWGAQTLADPQLKLIDRNLRWVVSTPIRIVLNGKTTVIGILNIDCLKEIKSRRDLETLEKPKDDLLATAKAIGHILLKGVTS